MLLLACFVAYFLALFIPMSIVASAYDGWRGWQKTWKLQLVLSLLGSTLTTAWDLFALPYLRSH